MCVWWGELVSIGGFRDVQRKRGVEATSRRGAVSTDTWRNSTITGDDAFITRCMITTATATTFGCFNLDRVALSMIKSGREGLCRSERSACGRRVVVVMPMGVSM